MFVGSVVSSKVVDEFARIGLDNSFWLILKSKNERSVNKCLINCSDTHTLPRSTRLTLDVNYVKFPLASVIFVYIKFAAIFQ